MTAGRHFPDGCLNSHANSTSINRWFSLERFIEKEAPTASPSFTRSGGWKRKTCPRHSKKKMEMTLLCSFCFFFLLIHIKTIGELSPAIDHLARNIDMCESGWVRVSKKKMERLQQSMRLQCVSVGNKISLIAFFFKLSIATVFLCTTLSWDRTQLFTSCHFLWVSSCRKILMRWGAY